VDGSWYRAAVNIGHNPTFRSKTWETAHVTVEAFLLDFAGDIYEHQIRVDFLHKIRDERRFDDVDALVAQMRRTSPRPARWPTSPSATSAWPATRESDRERRPVSPAPPPVLP